MTYANKGPIFPSYSDRPASFTTTDYEGPRSSIYESVLTHTTSSTVPGPGSLTGKAIKALGELALRGLDRLIIYARFQAILSNFPHTDSEVAGIKDIDGIYNVILELSRPGLYSKDLRNAALTLIITQLNRGQSHQLEKALAHWNIVELELFFSGMAFHSAPEAFSNLHVNHDISSYPAVAPDPTRLISMMSRVVLLNRRACEALHAQLFNFFLLLDKEQFPSASLTDFFRVVLHVASSEDQIYEARGQALNLFEILVSRSGQPFIIALAQWHNSDFGLLTSFIRNQRSASRSTIDVAPNVSLQQIASDEQFNNVLLILKDEPPVYTAEERGKTFEQLVFQITHGSPSLSSHKQLDEWNRQELANLLLMLTARLSQMITDNPASQLNSHLASFIFEVALRDQQAREAVIKAGFLEIVWSIKGDVSGSTTRIIDVFSHWHPYCHSW